MNIYSSNKFWSAYKDYDYLTVLNKVEEVYNSYKVKKCLNQLNDSNVLKPNNSKKSENEIHSQNHNIGQISK